MQINSNKQGCIPVGCVPPAHCWPYRGGGHAWQGGCVAGRHWWHACPPPVDRMTDACKNITLPQTSFAGGTNLVEGLIINRTCLRMAQASFLAELNWLSAGSCSNSHLCCGKTFTAWLSSTSIGCSSSLSLSKWDFASTIDKPWKMKCYC